MKKLRAKALLLTAALAVTALFPACQCPAGTAPAESAFSLAQAYYPETPDYPQEDNYFHPLTGEFLSDEYEADYDAWRAALPEAAEPGAWASLTPFFSASIRQFLSESGGENRVYSPLNVYFALAMLAETTGGESQRQILDLLGAGDLAALRAQASALWDAHYRDDGVVTSLLANSIWLDDAREYRTEPLETLAQEYYASSFRGEMGSDEYNLALQEWLKSQTGGLLDGPAGQIELDPQTVFALASTILFRANWSDEFAPHATAPGAFHGPEGDATCDMMHGSFFCSYFQGERFTAAGLALDQNAGTMWFLLPEEGLSPGELLTEPQAMTFLLGGIEAETGTFVHVTMPKFDVTSQMDLCAGLDALGVSDVFDVAEADFSPIASDPAGIWVSRVQHDARVLVDEEGVAAAAYTVISTEAGAALPEKEVDFVVDRPFVFAITGADGVPLFVGCVSAPAG